MPRNTRKYDRSKGSSEKQKHVLTSAQSSYATAAPPSICDDLTRPSQRITICGWPILTYTIIIALTLGLITGMPIGAGIVLGVRHSQISKLRFDTLDPNR